MLFDEYGAAGGKPDDDRRGEEWLVAVFALGVAFFHPLLVGLFSDARAFLAGIPLLFCYLFASWGVLIALMAWAAIRRRQPPSETLLSETYDQRP